MPLRFNCQSTKSLNVSINKPLTVEQMSAVLLHAEQICRYVFCIMRWHICCEPFTEHFGYNFENATTNRQRTLRCVWLPALFWKRYLEKPVRILQPGGVECKWRLHQLIVQTGSTSAAPQEWMYYARFCITIPSMLCSLRSSSPWKDCYSQVIWTQSEWLQNRAWFCTKRQFYYSKGHHTLTQNAFPDRALKYLKVEFQIYQP